MFKKIFLSLAVFGLTASCANAAVITYNFNSTPTGTYTETNFSNLFSGVTFDNNGGIAFYVQAPGTPPLNLDFSGNVIMNQNSELLGNSTIATFNSLVNFASVTLGDYGSDSDELFLKAYDSSNNEIASDYSLLPAFVNAGHTLSVSAANIASVEFYGH